MEPSVETSLAVDNRATTDTPEPVSISGWDVVDGTCCYSDGWTIRNLKAAAKLNHLHAYKNYNKSQLIEALAQ